MILLSSAPLTMHHIAAVKVVNMETGSAHRLCSSDDCQQREIDQASVSDNPAWMRICRLCVPPKVRVFLVAGGEWIYVAEPSEITYLLRRSFSTRH